MGLHRFYNAEDGQPNQSKGVYFPPQSWSNFIYFLPHIDEKVQALLKELPKKDFADLDHSSRRKLTTSSTK